MIGWRQRPWTRWWHRQQPTRGSTEHRIKLTSCYTWNQLTSWNILIKGICVTGSLTDPRTTEKEKKKEKKDIINVLIMNAFKLRAQSTYVILAWPLSNVHWSGSCSTAQISFGKIKTYLVTHTHSNICNVIKSTCTKRIYIGQHSNCIKGIHQVQSVHYQYYLYYFHTIFQMNSKQYWLDHCMHS